VNFKALAFKIFFVRSTSRVRRSRSSPLPNDRIKATSRLMNDILDDASLGLLLLCKGINLNNEGKDGSMTPPSNDSSTTPPSNDSNATHTSNDLSAAPTSSLPEEEM
jgi:hypothetical protein